MIPPVQTFARSAFAMLRRIGPQFLASVLATLCAAALTPMLLSRPIEPPAGTAAAIRVQKAVSAVPDRVPSHEGAYPRNLAQPVVRSLPIFATNAAFLAWTMQSEAETAATTAPPAAVAELLPRATPSAQPGASQRVPRTVQRPRSADQPAKPAGAPLDLIAIAEVAPKADTAAPGWIGRSVRGAGDMAAWAGGKVVGMLWP